MLSHLAMRASRVTARFPSDLSRLGRARVAPASSKPHATRRVAAFASWRMGGGGGAPADDPPPPSRLRDDRGARGRFDDDDGYVERYGDDEDFGSGEKPRDVGFASRRTRAGARDGQSNRERGGGRRGSPRSRGGGGGGRGGRDDFDSSRDRSVWQERHDEKKRLREESGSLTLAESLQGEAVYGANPVRAALSADRRTVHRVFVQEGSDFFAKDSVLKERVTNDLKIPIETVTKHDLNMLLASSTGSAGRPHNGVVADASPLAPTPLDFLPSWDGRGSPPVWLALDEVVDPQNLGARGGPAAWEGGRGGGGPPPPPGRRARPPHFLKVDGVVVCAKNSAPLSPTVSKASSGALESVEVYEIGVMHRFLVRCAEDGWDVLGAAGESNDAIDVNDIESIKKPTILVMGNEGVGLRTNVRRACTSLVRVDGGVEASTVDSLNVSVATGIILHALIRSARRER